MLEIKQERRWVILESPLWNYRNTALKDETYIWICCEVKILKQDRQNHEDNSNNNTQWLRPDEHKRRH